MFQALRNVWIQGRSCTPPLAAPRASCDMRVQLLPETPLSTVTARQFCDQQEMSSQIATGRSLP